MSDSGNLTQRERATLHAVTRGLTDAEVADELGLEKTVVTEDVAALCRHFGVDDREDLLAAWQVSFFTEDLDDLGFVMNVSRLWVQAPAVHDDFFALLTRVAHSVDLSLRHRLLIVLATASSRGSGYCALAWSTRFPDELPPETAAAVVSGAEVLVGLDVKEAALVRWARRVASSRSPLPPSDLQTLRAAGWGEEEVFAVTVFAALRTAFSAVNDALGASPDERLRHTVPPQVLAALTQRQSRESAT